jgi:hypothetical protein
VFSRRRSKVSPAHRRAEDEIAAALGGGDTLPAWNAVWDLVQSRDSHGKQELLASLKGYVDSEVSSEAAAQAQEFGNAIEGQLRPEPARRQILPSEEVRRQHKQEQMLAHHRAMRDIGVRPGEGLPMWAIYMTRRNKRSWG